jgi:hypothetical protein
MLVLYIASQELYYFLCFLPYLTVYEEAIDPYFIVIG